MVAVLLEEVLKKNATNLLAHFIHNTQIVLEWIFGQKATERIWRAFDLGTN